MVQDWISRAAQRDPLALAVVGEAETLTYGDIEDYSNRLAATLQGLGCRRGDRVGVHMPKSATAVASLIGILKSGCVYVPTDTTGAMVRTAEILRQSEPSVVLFDGCGPEALEDLELRGALRGVRTVWLGPEDREVRTTVRRSDVDRAATDLMQRTNAGPEDLAYILFTSGTTGSPKGVPISHASVRAFIEWVVRFFALGPADRLSGHTELTFDLSAFDMYASFASGAQLHHVPKQARMIPHELVNFLDERALTLWFSVPSQLSYVARFDALADRSLPSLRHVAWCGDVLPTPVLLHWKRRLPGVEFTNLYGPTETTIASSYYRVPADFTDATMDIPIGVACPGEELLILDETLEHVPVGVVGDIYIRGVGLSPGYWRDTDRTRDVFVARNGSGPLYRTGDLGRTTADGSIVFLGRSDFQIKSAGYRVEPAEVENAILRLEEIAACAVVSVASNGIDRTAIGCLYVPSNGTPLRAASVKKRLLEWIPPYMVPSLWMQCSDLPVNDRGKIDRGKARALFGG
jgi:amino acid adenylation domain-containing protein